MLTKRDTENSRLRELRDQCQAELNERKMKEQTRLASVLEFKALAENRSVCTVFYSECSELTDLIGTYRGSRIRDQEAEDPTCCQCW